MDCKIFNSKLLALSVVAVFAFASVSVLMADDSEAASGMTVTDGKGTEFTFSSTPEHIITIGKGVSATAIELGMLDKIVVCDSYSKSATESVYAELKAKISAGAIKANGNIYSAGKASLMTDIVDSADAEKGGVFDKNRDVIFITGSDTYLTSIIDTLRSSEYGFKYVMAWNDIINYEDIADFVETVSLVTKGSVDSQVAKMRNLDDVISAQLNGKEKKEAFYVTYSYSTFKVGNTGSLANSMIIAAGGNSITVDSSKASPTYETSITDLVANHPDAIIFVDNSIHSKTDVFNNLKTQVGDKVGNIVLLNSLWNNYCVESMDGVWTMACAMYPDTFQGDIPTPDDDKDDNTLLYIGGGVAVVIILLVVGLVFIRRH